MVARPSRRANASGHWTRRRATSCCASWPASRRSRVRRATILTLLAVLGPMHPAFADQNSIGETLRREVVARSTPTTIRPHNARGDRARLRRRLARHGRAGFRHEPAGVAAAGGGRCRTGGGAGDRGAGRLLAGQARYRRPPARGGAQGPAAGPGDRRWPRGPERRAAKPRRARATAVRRRTHQSLCVPVRARHRRLSGAAGGEMAADSPAMRHRAPPSRWSCSRGMRTTLDTVIQLDLERPLGTDLPRRGANGRAPGGRSLAG